MSNPIEQNKKPQSGSGCLSAIVGSVLGTIFGVFLSVLLADFACEMYGVTGHEGGKGFFAFFAFAPLMTLICCIAGTIGGSLFHSCRRSTFIAGLVGAGIGVFLSVMLAKSAAELFGVKGNSDAKGNFVFFCFTPLMTLICCIVGCVNGRRDGLKDENDGSN